MYTMPRYSLESCSRGGRRCVHLVAMATSDKHCQTFTVNTSSATTRICASEYARGMYDETVPVLNAKEIESPANSDEEEVVRSAMSKFNPPVRHTARHDFDSDSDSDSEPEKFLNNISGEDEVSKPTSASILGVHSFLLMHVLICKPG